MNGSLPLHAELVRSFSMSLRSTKLSSTAKTWGLSSDSRPLEEDAIAASYRTQQKATDKGSCERTKTLINYMSSSER